MSESDDPFIVEGRQRLRAGCKKYGRVVRLLSVEGGNEDLHRLLRDSLRDFRGAMNYLEDADPEQFERAHHLLDEAGRLARNHFSHGCVLSYHNSQYFQECPVALAHNRIGLSIGAKIKSMHCSICHGDPEDCEHIAGAVYDGERCSHVISDGEISEISIVGKPAHPDARLSSISISNSELDNYFGTQFTPGVPVTCDRCQSNCEGIYWPYRDEEHAKRVI